MTDGTKLAIGIGAAAAAGTGVGLALTCGVVIPYRNEALAWRAPGMTGGPGSGADNLVVKIITTVIGVLMALL